MRHTMHQSPTNSSCRLHLCYHPVSLVVTMIDSLSCRVWDLEAPCLQVSEGLMLISSRTRCMASSLIYQSLLQRVVRCIRKGLKFFHIFDLCHAHERRAPNTITSTGVWCSHGASMSSIRAGIPSQVCSQACIVRITI